MLYKKYYEVYLLQVMIHVYQNNGIKVVKYSNQERFAPYILQYSFYSCVHY